MLCLTTQAKRLQPDLDIPSVMVTTKTKERKPSPRAMSSNRALPFSPLRGLCLGVRYCKTYAILKLKKPWLRGRRNLHDPAIGEFVDYTERGFIVGQKLQRHDMRQTGSSFFREIFPNCWVVDFFRRKWTQQKKDKLWPQAGSIGYDRELKDDRWEFSQRDPQKTLQDARDRFNEGIAGTVNTKTGLKQERLRGPILKGAKDVVEEEEPDTYAWSVLPNQELATAMQRDVEMAEE